MKEHPHQHPENETKALKTRLRKILGQIQGIEKMMDESRDCSDVLTQLVSVRKALKSLSEQIIHSHMEHCIAHASSANAGRKKLQELLTVLERYVE